MKRNGMGNHNFNDLGKALNEVNSVAAKSSHWVLYIPYTGGLLQHRV